MSIPGVENKTSVEHIRLYLLWSSERRVEQVKEKQQEETEGIQKKRRLQPIPSLSISDLGPKLPFIKEDSSSRCLKLVQWLPLMAFMIWSHDFNFLLEFRGSKVDIKYALRLDLVGLCVWLLYTKAPPCLEEAAARALATFHNATSEAMFDDSIDSHLMPAVDNLVKTVLHSKDEQVLRQACCALTLLAICRRKGDDFAEDVTFGDGVLKWLLELVKHDSPYAVLAVSNIARVDKGMRDIIINAELEKSYLPGLLEGNDGTFLKYALRTIAYVTGGNDNRWDYMEGGLFPRIVEVLQTSTDIDVLVAAACLISNALDDATPDQIENLVDMGCLEALCNHLDVEDSRFLRYSLQSIEYILCIGDGGEGNKYENMYAKRITDKVGWSKFREVNFIDGSVYFQLVADELLVEFGEDDY